MLFVCVALAYAWIAWIVLAVAWIRQRRLHRWWPISGTVIGIVCIAWTLGFAIVFTFPAIGMAIVFVTFALSKEARQIEDTRRARAGS
jgi:ammonia channel protein AmtB